MADFQSTTKPAESGVNLREKADSLRLTLARRAVLMPCQRCDGTGWIADAYRDGDGNSYNAHCPDCNGTGRALAERLAKEGR